MRRKASFPYIIEHVDEPGRIAATTNMAGRGADIRLAAQIPEFCTRFAPAQSEAIGITVKCARLFWLCKVNNLAAPRVDGRI